MINIGGKNSDYDEFYRYKRNKLEIKQVRNQTEVVNLGVVIKQLNANPKELEQFLRKAISIPFSKNVFHGIVSVDEIEKHLEKYIKIYILCPKCITPEWTGKLCKACGYTIQNTKEIKFLQKEEEEEVSISLEDRIFSKILHALYDIYEHYEKKWLDEANVVSNNLCLSYLYNKPPCVVRGQEIIGECHKQHVSKLRVLTRCIEYSWESLHIKPKDNINEKIKQKIKIINEQLQNIGIDPILIDEV